MVKLSNQQERRIDELMTKNKVITRIVEARIDYPIQALPLNLILESRFNELAIAKIKLEAEIRAHRTKQVEGDVDSYEHARLRLERLRGQLSEIQHMAKVTKDFEAAGRYNYEICQ